MRIEQLQAFLAIVETGNFGQAARKCGVTQSTISRQIQSLEGDLKFSLFHRTAQAKLTIAGEKLLPRARRICQEWATVVQDIADLQAGKQPELCVAVIHSVCAYYLPPILQTFCKNYPDVQLRVTALGSDRSLKVLRDGLVDVAIVMNNRFLTTSADMVVELLYEEPIEVLMAADHPLTQFNTVTWSALTDYPQVVFKEGYGMQRLVQEWSARQETPMNIVMELNTLDAFRGVIRQGNIIALLPQTALVEARSDPSLAIRSLVPSPELLSAQFSASAIAALKGGLTRQVVLVTTVDRLQLPPVAHFCELVRQASPQFNPSLTTANSQSLP